MADWIVAKSLRHRRCCAGARGVLINSSGAAAGLQDLLRNEDGADAGTGGRTLVAIEDTRHPDDHPEEVLHGRSRRRLAQGT